MATIENRLGKLVERRERGLLTDAEVGNDVLLTLADVDESQRLTELFDSLPDRLQATVRNRLNELQKSGFNWRPFMIGEGLSEAELERLRQQLRSIHATLSDSD